MVKSPVKRTINFEDQKTSYGYGDGNGYGYGYGDGNGYGYGDGKQLSISGEHK
jgi:hypothetical protein